MSSGTCFRLGDWLVDASLNRIFNGDTEIHLEPRSMQVLIFLAENADQLVSKQDLIDHVWQAEVVAHSSLTGIIARLRHALGDDSRFPRYIETIHTKGYRLIAEVTPADAAECRQDLRTNGCGHQHGTPRRDASIALDEAFDSDARFHNAESGLLRTIDESHRHGRRHQELRAATRLASLWHSQGRTEEAVALLRPLVSHWEQGAESLPVLQAKALLWDLTDTLSQ